MPDARFLLRLTVPVALLLSSCATSDDWTVEGGSPAPGDPAASRDSRETQTLVAEIGAGDDTPRPRPDAEGVIELSIEEAVLFALQRNRDLGVQRLNPVIAGAFEKIERGAYDTELFAEFQTSEEVASETDRGTGQQFPVSASGRSAGIGLRQRLPTGTDIEAGVFQDRDASDRAPEQQSARLGLSITQSLLRGFGPAANLASVRQATLDTEASHYELRGFAEALLANAEVAYWNHVRAELEIAIFERSLELSRRQRDEIEEQIEVGFLPETEAAAARAEVALREQALIDARSVLEENRLQLARLMNLEEEGSLDLAFQATTPPRLDAPQPIDDLPDRIALARQSRPDLNEARLRLRQSRLETVATRNGLLPRLDLFVNLGQTGYADTFRDSFRTLDGDTYDVTAGFSFTQALGNRAAEGRDLAARAQYKQSKKAVGNLEQLVLLDVRLAANQVNRARQQIDATAATVALQEQTLEAEEERLEAGTGTSLLVAQAARDLLASRIDEAGAVIDHRIALVELYLAEGSLLERRGIRVP